MNKKVEPIIDMHDTWLAINSIQGCTNGCKYCFLQGINNHIEKPNIIATAAEAIDALFSSKYYDSIIPICLLPGTDAFLNKQNIEHLKELLGILEKNQVSNPIVLITKCLIPNDMLDYLENLKNKGLKIVVYLSYSGLGKEYEPNINHENIKLNFQNLASRGIQIIHYYRPFVVDNSNAKQIESTLDFVKNYTDISVVTGLKLRSDFIDKIKFLEILKEKRNECLNASSIWPKEAYNYFFEDYQNTQNIFQTNYCGLAQALKEPCPQYYGTHECKNYNHCSKEQRERCKNFKKISKNQLKEKLIELLNKLEKNIDNLEIIEEENNIILKNIDLNIAEAAFITRLLGYKVSLYNKQEDDIHFSSSITNSKPLIY